MTAPSDPVATRSPLRPRGPVVSRLATWILGGTTALYACTSTPQDEPIPDLADGVHLADGAHLAEGAHAMAWILPEVATDPLHRVVDVGLHATDDGALESDTLGDGETFTEALPSWNVPSGAPFTVEIRAQAAEDDAAWSPWLRIGEWGSAPRDGSTPTRFEGGKVAVDVLQLEDPYRALQLRFRGTDAPLLPGEVMASVVLSDMGQLGRRIAAASQDPWPGTAFVKVAPRSQRTEGDDIGGRICSPTSVSMVSAYRGADIPTRTMAETLFDPHHDIYGNWNRAVQGPATLGVPGRLVRVSSWAAVASYLRRGFPVVASIRAEKGQLRGAPYQKTAGHLLVVTGLGPAGAVHVNDPAAKRPLDVPRVYQRADMEKVWFANGGVAYVFGPHVGAEESTHPSGEGSGDSNR